MHDAAPGAPAPARGVQPFVAVPPGGNGRRAPVARLLGVSTATVYRLCGEGRLAHVRVGNAIRVRPVDLETFIGSGRP